MKLFSVSLKDRKGHWHHYRILAETEEEAQIHAIIKLKWQRKRKGNDPG